MFNNLENLYFSEPVALWTAAPLKGVIRESSMATTEGKLLTRRRKVPQSLAVKKFFKEQIPGKFNFAAHRRVTTNRII